jgi:hypothetical protein
MRWAGHIACMEERGSAYKGLVGKPEGRIPSGRPRHRLMDNIKREIIIYGVNWIHLAQNRGQWWILVNTVMVLRVPYNVRIS